MKKNSAVTIRKMTYGDIKTVSTLHEKNLESPWSKIGLEPLFTYWRLLLGSGAHICLVACQEDQIVGAICTTVDMKKTDMILKKLLSFKIILAVFLALASRNVSLVEIINRLRVKHIAESKLGKSYSWILTLFVDGNFRRMGIGEKLFSATLQVLKKKKTKKLYVDSYISNKAALLFYRAQGFENREQIIDSVILEYKWR